MDNWKSDVNSTDRPKDSNEQKKAYITALLREREQLVRRGLDERVALVDEQLRYYGHEATKPVERAARRPGRPPRVEQREATESVGE